MNYIIVLFKDKIKKKIINKFKTEKRANEYYFSLLSKSDDVIFDKKHENGFECEYKIALLEKNSTNNSPLFLKDEYGRQNKIELDDDDYTIIKISDYRIEEEFVDFNTNKKLHTTKFIKTYLEGSGLKLVSKLNNKIIVQNDDDLKLFTLKNENDCLRFIETISDLFISNKRIDCMFVKDSSTTQRKYLYELLVNKGYSKEYLFRQSTTHPSKK
jgi:hypothetical protein